MSLIHAVIIGSVFGLISIKGNEIWLHAPVGDNVLLNTTLAPATTPFTSITWIVNSAKVILTSNVTDNITSPEYEGRITLFPSTGSLELRNVTRNDTGRYAFNITQEGSPQIDNLIKFYVYEPISNVTVEVSSTDVVEYNSSVTMTCSALPGKDVYYKWLNGSTSIGYNQEMTLWRIKRYDTGPLTCVAFSWFSNGTSEPVSLSISYGPDNVNVKPNPSREFYEKGSDVTLSCSADSKPEAEDFRWFLNTKPLSATGAELVLKKLQMNQTGFYTCQAFNRKTLRYTMSQFAVITIPYGPNNVQISGPREVQEKTPLKLTCSAESFPAATYTWLKDDKIIGRSSEYTKNISEFTDSGEYYCRASNTFTDTDTGRFHWVDITSQNTLSAGAIVGITIACLTVAGGVVAGGLYLYSKT